MVSLISVEGTWVEISYKSIPKNRFEISPDAVKIDVRSSAGALVYAFTKPIRISYLEVRGEVQNLLEPAKKIGSKHPDDFLLRIGPVRAGERRLRFFERFFAAPWILELDQIASKVNRGFGYLDLYLVASLPGPEWTTRDHPSSDFIHETVALRLPKSGEFTLKKEFLKEDDLEALGLWLGADGDDSASSFQVKLNKIVLR